MKSCPATPGGAAVSKRILSANIPTWGPQAEGFLRSSEVGRFQTALAEHHIGQQHQHIRQAAEADWLPRHTSNNEAVRKLDQRYIKRNKHGHGEPCGAGRLEKRARALWF